MKQAVTLFFCFITMTAFSQEEKYYQITKVQREDKEPFRGFTIAFMQDYLDSYYHFVKKGNALHFDLPEKKVIAENDLKSLNDKKFDGKFWHEIYENKVVGNKYIIKFKDNATSSSSKNTIIEFTEITKDQYYKNIEEEIAFKTKVASEITSLKERLEKNPMQLGSPKILDKKTQVIEDPRNREITFLLPKEYSLRQSGNIKNKAFGELKTGTLKENSIVYEVEKPNTDSSLNDVTIYMLTDKAQKFDIETFLKTQTSYAIITQDKNSFVAYQVSYDFDAEKPIIYSYEMLKYYYFKGTHVFISSSMQQQDRYLNGVKQPQEDLLPVVKTNFDLLHNISVKI